jgi:hypothetical protein
MKMEAAGVGGGVGGGSFRAMPPPAAAPAPMALSGIGPQAQASEAGELFEYRFPAPVSARKGESAAIPFLQQKVSAKKLLIYSDRSSPNPRSALEIANDTGKTLDGGPITVYQGSAYGGEALIETLKSGDKRLISYAVDLGTRVTTNFESGAEVVRQITANRGVMTLRSSIETTTTYSIVNVDAKEKALVIEHPVSPSLKLLRPKVDETTANHYRFDVRLAAKGSQKLAVVEEQILENAISVSELTPDVLYTYVQSKGVTARARQQLEAILARKRSLAEVDSQINAANTEIGETTKDEDRLRQNIATMSRVSGQQDQVQSYAVQLAKQDAALASLHDRIAELRKKKTALESELSSLIEKMEF